MHMVPQLFILAMEGHWWIFVWQGRNLERSRQQQWEKGQSGRTWPFTGLRCAALILKLLL